MLGKIGIYTVLTIIFLPVILQGMYQSKNVLTQNLANLEQHLQVLEDLLKKEVPVQPAISPGVWTELNAAAQAVGKTTEEFIKWLLSQAQSGAIPPEVPGIVPPPPPPPPLVVSEPVEPKTPKTPKKPQEQEKPNISLADILKKGAELKKVTEPEKKVEKIVYTSEQLEKSDTLFLDAFRTANSIDDIIENLKALRENSEYLKQDDLKESVALDKPGPLKIEKVKILDLLSKKSKLILRELNRNDRKYLKDYLFDIKKFTDADADALKDLIENEEAKKLEKAAEKAEKQYEPWQEIIKKVITDAKDLDDVINFVRALPPKERVQKSLPNVVIKLKGKSSFIIIGSDELEKFNKIENQLNKKGQEVFVKKLKKIIPEEDLRKKLDNLLKI